MQNATIKHLQTTSWLAIRLGVSVKTIERIRANSPEKLPASVMIGNSIRYDEAIVESWIAENVTKPTSMVFEEC